MDNQPNGVNDLCNTINSGLKSLGTLLCVGGCLYIGFYVLLYTVCGVLLLFDYAVHKDKPVPTTPATQQQGTLPDDLTQYAAPSQQQQYSDLPTGATSVATPEALKAANQMAYHNRYHDGQSCELGTKAHHDESLKELGYLGREVNPSDPGMEWICINGVIRDRLTWEKEVNIARKAILAKEVEDQKTKACENARSYLTYEKGMRSIEEDAQRRGVPEYTSLKTYDDYLIPQAQQAVDKNCTNSEQN